MKLIKKLFLTLVMIPTINAITIYNQTLNDIILSDYIRHDRQEMYKFPEVIKSMQSYDLDEKIFESATLSFEKNNQINMSLIDNQKKKIISMQFISSINLSNIHEIKDIIIT